MTQPLSHDEERRLMAEILREQLARPSLKPTGAPEQSEAYAAKQTDGRSRGAEISN